MACNIEMFTAQFLAFNAFEIIKKHNQPRDLESYQTEVFIYSVQELNELLQLYFSQSGEEKSETREKIRDVGEQLNRLGGFRLMSFTCQFLVNHKYADIYLNSIWNGIGTWMA